MAFLLSRHDLATFGAYLKVSAWINSTKRGHRVGLSSSKLLAFIVSERGIEADPAKVKAIALSMSSPRNLKELRSLPGRFQPLIKKALKLYVNPFPVKTQTLFGGRSTKKSPPLALSASLFTPIPPKLGRPCRKELNSKRTENYCLLLWPLRKEEAQLKKAYYDWLLQQAQLDKMKAFRPLSHC